MNVVQMWKSIEYPEKLIHCTKSVIRIFGADNYTMICNNQEIADKLGVSSKNFDDEYAMALESLGKRDWWEAYCSQNMYCADTLRLYYATIDNDMLYIDGDFYFTKPFTETFLPGKPYVMPGHDFAMFYVNGCVGVFKEMCDKIPTRMNPTNSYCVYRYVRDYFLRGNAYTFRSGKYIRNTWGN
jgi:hypothetical protein